MSETPQLPGAKRPGNETRATPPSRQETFIGQVSPVLKPFRIQRKQGSLILIATANPSCRRRWVSGLSDRFAIQCVGDRSALDQSVPLLKPAVLVLDPTLPKFGGIRDVESIRRLSPSTTILLLTLPRPNVKQAAAALKAGARSSCGGDIDRFLLAKAVEAIQQGEYWVSRNVIGYLLGERGKRGGRTGSDVQKGGSLLGTLSRRERETAMLIASGATNKQTAEELDIAERTVKAHLTSIFRKLGVFNRTQLALLLSKAVLGSNPMPKFFGRDSRDEGVMDEARNHS